MIAKNVNEAALIQVITDLLKAVVSENNKTAKFRTLLRRLEKTLRYIEPILYGNGRLSRVLDRSENEVKMFLVCVEDGRSLVIKCSSIKCWNVYKKFVHVCRLIRLDHELWRFFESELVGNVNRVICLDNEIRALGDKMDQVLSAVTKRAGGFSSSRSIFPHREVILLQSPTEYINASTLYLKTSKDPHGQLAITAQ